MRTKGTAVVLAIGLVLLTGTLGKASHGDCRGERRMCEALITPEITVVEVSHGFALEGRCGVGAAGCAKISADFKTCTVYVKGTASNVTRLHEMNHCLGWNHVSEHPSGHRKPWVPFEAVENWLEKGLPMDSNHLQEETESYEN